MGAQMRDCGVITRLRCVLWYGVLLHSIKADVLAEEWAKYIKGVLRGNGRTDAPTRIARSSLLGARVVIEASQYAQQTGARGIIVSESHEMWTLVKQDDAQMRVPKKGKLALPWWF